MKHRSNYPIIILLFGIALIVAAAVLFQNGITLWFWILMPVGLLVCAAAALELRNPTTRAKRSQTDGDKRPSSIYRRKQAVMSAPEREFYDLLKRTLSTEYFCIFPQLALVSVIDKTTQNGFRNELFRVADFCVVDAWSTEPLLLIELNDASHLRADRAERDRKVAEICDNAQLPLVTFTLEEARDEAYVRSVLRKRL